MAPTALPASAHARTAQPRAPGAVIFDARTGASAETPVHPAEAASCSAGLVAIGASPLPPRPATIRPLAIVEITHWATSRAAMPGRYGGRLTLTTTQCQPAGPRIMPLV